jgi:hypothetical protein
MVTTIIRIEIPPESNFDLLQLLPNISTMSHSQKIYLLSLCHDFALHSGYETATYILFSERLLLDQPPY